MRAMKYILEEIVQKTKKYMAICMVALSCCLVGCSEDTTEVSNVENGMIAIENFEYEDALTYFETATVKGEDTQLIARGKGLTYIGMAEYEEAIVYLEEALGYSNQNIEEVDYDINYYLGLAYYKSGMLEDAYNTYSAVIAMRPKEEEAYYLRGVVLLAQGNNEEAMVDLEQSISLSGNNCDRIIDVFCSLTDAGQTQSATELLELSLEQDEKDMSTYEKGRVYYYLQQYDEARVALEEVKDSYGSDAVYFLGKTYEELEEYNYAISVYLNYLVENADDAAIYNQLGLCQLKMGEYQSALDAFESAQEIEGSGIMQSLLYNEIICYEYLGDFNKALVLMKSYLEAYPDDAAALKEYEFLQTR